MIEQGTIVWAIALVATIIIYIIRQEGKVKLLNNKLDNANWKVDHLTAEGVKFKDKQTIFEVDITEIKGMQREATNNIAEIKEILKRQR